MQPAASDNTPTIHITGHNLDVTPAIRSHIEKKLPRLQHHFANIIDIKFTLTLEKGDKRVKERKELQKASARILLSHGEIFAEAAEEDMYASIDVLMDKLDDQIKKHKEIMKDKNKG